MPNPLAAAPRSGGSTEPGHKRTPGASRGWKLTRLAGLLLCAAILVLTALTSLAVGAKAIPLSDVLAALTGQGASSDVIVVLDLRVPRTLLGLAVGAALGLSGVLMQALTRNPLADPGLLGVNIGASVAVVLAIWLFNLVTTGAYVWFSFLGAAAASVLVYLLGSRGTSGPTPVRLALAGTVVSAVLGSVVSMVTILNPAVFDSFRFWGVGTLAGIPLDSLLAVLPFMGVGTILALALAGELNALALGDDAARALGSRTGLTRLLGVVAITLLCGAATAAVGPVGFIGLAIPHLARLICGVDHRWVLAYALVLGPILLLGSDILGRVIASPGEIQAGIITALLGAPLFIHLVRRNKVAQL